MDVLRRDYLPGQLQAVDARLRMLAGERFTFDEESRALYDAVAPTHDEDYFARTLSELDARLPGTGPVPERHEAFKRDFIIPPRPARRRVPGRDRRVPRAHARAPGAARATSASRSSTSRASRGPATTGIRAAPRSLIQVNTDLPIYIDRAIDLAAHEGYPGHHVYNALLEEHLVRGRGWVEFSVYALFSPQSLIAEGTANFGIDVAFPGPERVAFERDRAVPARRPRSGARRGVLRRRSRSTERLAYAGNEAARRYLNGEIVARGRRGVAGDVRAAARAPRAEQRVRFFDQYRSYVINYNLGKDLVRAYIEARGGTADHPARRWAEFGALVVVAPPAFRLDPTDSRSGGVSPNLRSTQLRAIAAVEGTSPITIRVAGRG